MKCYLILAAVFFLFSLTGCSTGYVNEGDAVYYKSWNEGSGGHKARIDASPETFRVLHFDRYAKDHKNVFYQGRLIEGADPGTFEAIAEFYARDKNTGYHGGNPVRNSDGRSFRVVNAYYTTDGKDYFYDTSALHMADPANFRFVYGEGDFQCWTTDGKFYYYNNYKVPSEDYDHLIIYEESGGISKDRYWAYFMDHKLNYDEEGKRIVDTIDIASFKASGFLECRDKWGCLNVYHGREECGE